MLPIFCFQIVSPQGTVSVQTENGPMEFHAARSGEPPMASGASSDTSSNIVDSSKVLEEGGNIEGNSNACEPNNSTAEITDTPKESSTAVIPWSPFGGIQSIGNIFLGIHKALRRSLRRSLFRFTPELQLQ